MKRLSHVKRLSRYEWIRQQQWRALEAFSEHEMLEANYWDEGICELHTGKQSRKCKGARWLIGRPGTFVYRVEILAGIGGSLMVHGDIDFVRFAHYGDHADAISRLYWMGFCHDLDYYVAQKAGIGSGHDHVDQYIQEVAEHELQEMADDQERSPPERDMAAWLLRQNVTWHREDLLEAATRHSAYDGELVHGLGIVPHQRVIYAHAALNKCASLIWQEQRLQDLFDAVTASLGVDDLQGDRHSSVKRKPH